MLSQICEFLNKHSLKMLRYVFICSRVQDGISGWGTAAKTKLSEIELLLNNVRTIRVI